MLRLNGVLLSVYWANVRQLEVFNVILLIIDGCFKTDKFQSAILAVAITVTVLNIQKIPWFGCSLVKPDSAFSKPGI